MGKFGWDLPPGVSMSDIDPGDAPLESESCETGDHLACEEDGCECDCHSLVIDAKQRANWNAVADGFAPPYPDEY